jgi:hypothetical protein
MKAKQTDRPPGTLKPPTQAQIAALAHELWLAQGQPTGSDIDIWLEAERQLQGAPPRPIVRDPIPADPGNLDEDVALSGSVERELGGVGGEPIQRSPTALDF